MHTLILSQLVQLSWPLLTICTRTNANVIPAASWSVLEILRIEHLKERVLAEIDPCFAFGSVDANIAQLCSLPLFTSIYMETLRLRSSAVTARQPLNDEFQLGKWSFKKGGTLFAAPWLGA